MDEWKIFNKIVNSDDITRILLYGVPGTGKTTQAVKTRENKDDCYIITVNEESSVSEILGMYVPKENEFKWKNGVAVKSWLNGKLLVINEIDKASGSVLTVLNAILDDATIAKMTLPNGRDVEPNESFTCIATMNGTLDELPESLVDRFDIKLNITVPHEDAIKSLPEDLHQLVRSAYSRSDLSISFRDIQTYAKLRNIISQTDALKLSFGDNSSDVKTALQIGIRDVATSPVYTVVDLNNYYMDTPILEDIKVEKYLEIAEAIGIPPHLKEEIILSFSQLGVVEYKQILNNMNDNVMVYLKLDEFGT